jgi:Polypeptide deformylase
LFGALQKAGEQHVFSKGMGIAAPQIGISRAAAIVIPPDPGAEPVVMLNLAVISESAETDEQYEGCLFFFDVRGLVPARCASRSPARSRTASSTSSRSTTPWRGWPRTRSTILPGSSTSAVCATA